MLSNIEIANIRQEYTLKQFDETHLLSNPMEQFQSWFKEAIDANVNEPNAFTLSTVKYDGKPAARIVLLKGITPNGFVFFTNYDSNKGKQITANPFASMVFFWPELQRQIRIEGAIAKNPEKDSDAYFLSRPFESQLGAHASPQSQPLKSRQELEDRFIEMEKLFKTEPILRPRHWGGYIIQPQTIEFWQGRASRLHDRFLFSIDAENNWKYCRLAP